MDILDYRIKQAVKSINGMDCEIAAIACGKAFVTTNKGHHLSVYFESPAEDRRRTKVIKVGFGLD